jgi:hypothetical protein
LTATKRPEPGGADGDGEVLGETVLVELTLGVGDTVGDGLATVPDGVGVPVPFVKHVPVVAGLSDTEGCGDGVGDPGWTMVNRGEQARLFDCPLEPATRMTYRPV